MTVCRHRRSPRVPARAAEPVHVGDVDAFAVVLLLQQRQDLRPPDPLQAALAVDALLHQVRRPDAKSASSMRALSASSRSAGSASRSSRVRSQRRSSPRAARRGEQLDEGEPSPHRRVDQRDRPVGGVHRADDEQVRRQREVLSPEYVQADRLVAVLQQEVQLAEDLRQVGPVDLVDDQDVRDVPVLLAGGWSASSRSGPAVQPEARASRRRRPAGPEALEEVLVGVRRVELDEFDLPGRSAEVLGELQRQVGLSGARRPVEHELPFVRQQVATSRSQDTSWR